MEQSFKHSWRGLSWGVPLAGMVAAGLLAAAPAASAQGTVNVGISTTLSGPIAELGQTGLRGVEMAVGDINAKGGLLGKQIKVLSADDNLSPATGTSNIRHMILSDKAVAIFGPVSSAVGVAEATVAGQYKTPYFTFTSNDIKMTTTDFTKYTFQLVPNTVMEPRAIAKFLANEIGDKPITLATITPNYSFGRDTVDELIKALKADGAKVTVTTQQTPQLGATQYTTYIAALLAAPAQYTFIGQYGGDLITFAKQAKGFGFFKHTKAAAAFDRAELKALPGQVPAGMIAWNRAPFWAMTGPGMEKFTADYHKKYNEWPAAWSILGYTAVQSWADGVTKAGSFDSGKVVDALSGAKVQTIRGPITLRACDHQADVAEYIGTVAPKIDPKYGFQIYTDTKTIPASETMLTCKEAKALQPGT